MWASGNYHAFARSTIWDFGPLLVEATGISPGQRVLDVGAGTGNVAIRAALAGADVVASDLTPENFPAGQAEAAARGVDLQWIEADAEALPFADDEFDVVTSSVGAIFAPHHRAVAAELLRVCKPGGTIGMIAVVPAGAVRHVFEIVSRFAPGLVEPGPESPLSWGLPSHVRELFGDRVESLTFEPHFIEPSPLRDIERLERQHPVFVSIHRELADEPSRLAAFEEELADLARRWRDEPQELLVIVARKRRR
jgi:SAM-dependent methyltransferase